MFRDVAQRHLTSVSARRRCEYKDSRHNHRYVITAFQMALRHSGSFLDRKKWQKIGWLRGGARIRCDSQDLTCAAAFNAHGPISSSIAVEVHSTQEISVS